MVVGVPGTWVPCVHGVCWHNEYVALAKRALGPTPMPGDPGCAQLEAAFGRLRAVARKYRGSRWGYLETAQSYKGALRRRYLNAYDSLMLEGPLRSSDYKLRSFVKAEKRNVQNVAKPRLIFPRSPRYNLHIASWLKPFEHWLWGNLKSGAVGGVGNSRVVAKGLNAVQRANLIVKKFGTVRDCVVFEVDGRAFEAHLLVQQLRGEQSVYNAAYRDPELREALSHQLRNKGVTTSGLRFARDGGRASGDFNTGMGNSIVMLAVVMASLSYLNVEEWDTLVDGDNALLFLPRHVSHRVVRDFAEAALFVSGHEMALERATDVIEEVRFGQSAPVFDGVGWQMVREWRKVISQGTSSHVHLREPRFARSFLRGVALCESSLAHRVPILWTWTRRLLACTEGERAAGLTHLSDYLMLGVDVESCSARQAAEPSWEARQSFHRAFGLTPDEQRNIEHLLGETQLVTEFSAPEDVSDVYGYQF